MWQPQASILKPCHCLFSPARGTLYTIAPKHTGMCVPFFPHPNIIPYVFTCMCGAKSIEILHHNDLNFKLNTHYDFKTSQFTYFLLIFWKSCSAPHFHLLEESSHVTFLMDTCLYGPGLCYHETCDVEILVCFTMKMCCSTLQFAMSFQTVKMGVSTSQLMGTYYGPVHIIQETVVCGMFNKHNTTCFSQFIPSSPLPT